MVIGVDAAPDILGGGRFAQNVAQGRQHEGKGLPGPAAQSRRMVQHQHGVGPDVPFPVKARLLGHAHQGLHLREPVGQLPHVPQGLEKQRGALRLKQGLAQLPLHPLRRQGGQVDAPAQGDGLRGRGEPEPGGKLGPPQHPQRVLRKGPVIHMPQHAPAQVPDTVEMVQHPAGQHVLHQGVYGEVPPPGGLLRAQKGVHGHVEIPVAPANGPLPPGHGDVQAIALEAVDPEAGPHLQVASQAV